VSAATGHRYDGRRFSGTYTRVEEYPMRFNGEETVAIKKYPIRRIACNGQGIKKGRISISFFFGTTHIISLPWQFIHVGRKKLKVIAK